MACARIVAVVVPSPATSLVFDATSRTIWAPRFSSLPSSSTSFATVTPSFVMVGPPNFFSSTTLRPLGPKVTFTTLASAFTPRRMACLESSPYTICFAIDVSLSLQNSEHLVFAHQQVLIAVQLDLVARVFAEQNALAHLHVERHHFAVFEQFAFSNREHLSLLRLLFRRIGNDDAPADRLFVFHSFHHDAVIERTNFHRSHLQEIENWIRNRTRRRAIQQPGYTLLAHFGVE